MPDALVAGGIGLVGVMIGAALSGFLELWRIALSARAAARVVRFEILDNINKCQLAIAFRQSALTLSDQVWNDNRLQLGQVVPEDAFLLMTTGYSSMFLAQKGINDVAINSQGAIRELEEWSKRMMIHLALLKQVEARSRVAQMLDLITGRQTYPAGRKGSAPVEDAMRNAGHSPADAAGRDAVDEAMRNTFGDIAGGGPR